MVLGITEIYLNESGNLACMEKEIKWERKKRINRERSHFLFMVTCKEHILAAFLQCCMGEVISFCYWSSTCQVLGNKGGREGVWGDDFMCLNMVSWYGMCMYVVLDRGEAVLAGCFSTASTRLVIPGGVRRVTCGCGRWIAVERRN